jgi:hypothetical protein
MTTILPARIILGSRVPTHTPIVTSSSTGVTTVAPVITSEATGSIFSSSSVVLLIGIRLIEVEFTFRLERLEELGDILVGFEKNLDQLRCNVRVCIVEEGGGKTVITNTSSAT